MITAPAMNAIEVELATIYSEESHKAAKCLATAQMYERLNDFKKAYNYYRRLSGLAMTNEQDWISRSKVADFEDRFGWRHNLARSEHG